MTVKEKVQELLDVLKGRKDLGDATIVVYAECVEDLDADLVKNLEEKEYEEFTAKSKLPVLRFGDAGKAVSLLQALLELCGYDCGGIDGIFGGNTQSALYRYQDMNGLTADGVAGDNTWRSFYGRF